MEDREPWDVEYVPPCHCPAYVKPKRRPRVAPFSYQGNGFTIAPKPRQDRVTVSCPPVGGLRSPAARMAARHAVHQYAERRSEFLMTPRGAIRFIEAMGETPPPEVIPKGQI